jgi:hypothetical protein
MSCDFVTKANARHFKSCLNFVPINRKSKVIFAKIKMFGRFRDNENFLENENFRENEMSRNFVFCENEKGIFVSAQVQVVRN